MRLNTALLVLAAAGTVPVLPAQEKQEAKVFRVEYTIRDGSEAAGKTGRKYVLLVESGDRATFRVGSRVPYPTSSFQPGTGGAGVTPLVSTQYNYADVGVNIDTRVQIREAARIQLMSSIEVSNIASAEKPGIPPTIAQVRVNVTSTLNPGKPTQIASIEDPVTLKKFDIEAVVTPVN